MKHIKLLRGIALFWCFFIGLGAVGGAVTMLVDPAGQTTGMGGLLPGLRKLPFADALFADLTFAGISLLIVNGLTQLATAALLLKRKPCASKCVVACGCVLMLWICIQFVVFPFNWLSTAYFVFGVLEADAGLHLVLAEKKARKANENDSAPLTKS